MFQDFHGVISSLEREHTRNNKILKLYVGCLGICEYVLCCCCCCRSLVGVCFAQCWLYRLYVAHISQLCACICKIFFYLLWPGILDPLDIICFNCVHLQVNNLSSDWTSGWFACAFVMSQRLYVQSTDSFVLPLRQSLSPQKENDTFPCCFRDPSKSYSSQVCVCVCVYVWIGYFLLSFLRNFICPREEAKEKETHTQHFGAFDDFAVWRLYLFREANGRIGYVWNVVFDEQKCSSRAFDRWKSDCWRLSKVAIAATYM